MKYYSWVANDDEEVGNKNTDTEEDCPVRVNQAGAGSWPEIEEVKLRKSFLRICLFWTWTMIVSELLPSIDKNWNKKYDCGEQKTQRPSNKTRPFTESEANHHQEIIKSR